MVHVMYVMSSKIASARFLRQCKMPCFPLWRTWLLLILSLTPLVIPSMNISIFISLLRIPLIIPFSHVSAAHISRFFFWLIQDQITVAVIAKNSLQQKMIFRSLLLSLLNLYVRHEDCKWEFLINMMLHAGFLFSLFLWNCHQCTSRLKSEIS